MLKRLRHIEGRSITCSDTRDGERITGAVSYALDSGEGTAQLFIDRRDGGPRHDEILTLDCVPVLQSSIIDHGAAIPPPPKIPKQLRDKIDQAYAEAEEDFNAKFRKEWN